MEQLNIITRLDPQVLFWWTNRAYCHPSWNGRGHSLRWFHLPLSMYQQNTTLPYKWSTYWDRISRNQSNRMGSSRLYDVWSHPPLTTHKRSWHASVSPSSKSNSPKHGTTASACIHTRTLNAHSREHGGVRNSSWHSIKVTKSMKYETWHFEPHSFQRVYQHS